MVRLGTVIVGGCDRKAVAAIGETVGEFATVAGYYADSQALLAHEIGDLLGLRHPANGLMRPADLEGGTMRSIHSSSDLSRTGLANVPMGFRSSKNTPSIRRPSAFSNVATAVPHSTIFTCHP